MSHKFRIQSKSTKYYIKSSKDDKDGQDVTTTDGGSSVPPDTILLLIPGKKVGTVHLTGVAGLYISLAKEVVGTRLTWSKQEYPWRIVANSPGKDYYIVPADGKDLYWFDKFGIGPFVIVEDGKDITPPESEWYITQAD